MWALQVKRDAINHAACRRVLLPVVTMRYTHHPHVRDLHPTFEFEEVTPHIYPCDAGLLQHTAHSAHGSWQGQLEDRVPMVHGRRPRLQLGKEKWLPERRRPLPRCIDRINTRLMIQNSLVIWGGWKSMCVGSFRYLFAAPCRTHQLPYFTLASVLVLAMMTWLCVRTFVLFQAGDGFRSSRR